MNCRPIFFLFIVFGYCALEGHSLDLENCRQLALQHNREIQIAQLEVDKWEGKKRETRSHFFPTLDFSGSYTRNSLDLAPELDRKYEDLKLLPEAMSQIFLGSVTDPGMKAYLGQKIQELIGGLDLPGGLPDRLGEFHASLQLTQPIFTGFKLTNGFRAVEEARQAALHRYRLVLSDLSFEVTQTYYQCLLADQLVQVHAETVQTGSAHLAIIENMRRQGLASEWELLKARVHIQKLTPDWIEAQRNRDLIYGKMKMLLGREQNENLELNANFNVVELPDTVDVDALYSQALQKREEMLALQSVGEAASFMVKKAYGDYLPDIAALASYTYLGLKDDYQIKGDDINTIFTVGVVARWNLFSFGEHSGKVCQARADREKVMHQSAQLKDYIYLQIKNAGNRVRHARENVALQKEAGELAEKSLEIAETSYRNGEARQVDVLDAQLDLQAARLHWNYALFETILADLELKKVIGDF